MTSARPRPAPLAALMLLITAATLFAQVGPRPAGYLVHNSEAAMLSFYYPETYVVEGQGETVAVATRQALLDQMNSDQPDLRPGDAVLALGVLPIGLLTMMGIPQDEVDVMVEAMFESMIAQTTSPDDVSRGTLDYPAGSVGTVTFDDPEQGMSGAVFLSAGDEEVVVFAIAIGLRDDLERNRRTLGQIVASAEFTGDLSEMMEGIR